jgi:hypothetical protein
MRVYNPAHRTRKETMPLRTFILGTLLLLTLIVGAYWPSVSKQSGFVWNDEAVITGHRVPDFVPATQPLAPAPPSLTEIWTLRRPQAAPAPRFAPLTGTSFWLDYQWCGLVRPRGYHMTNLALHAACALLIWITCARLGLGHVVSFVTAALFALHPMNVESVAWISSRANSLSLLFLLLYTLA